MKEKVAKLKVRKRLRKQQLVQKRLHHKVQMKQKKLSVKIWRELGQ